ncbi:MAG: hypothetical protein ACRDNG_12235 [Gaiellaceae bacterium]
MRFAQTLVKAALILAVIAVALGGAVALGSTLFEAPPRDAAEFAARVEAGSRHALPVQKRTVAERRYVLALGELCGERNERVDKLELAVDEADRVRRLRSWRAIFADYAEDFTALSPPRRYRTDAARVAALAQGMLDLTDGAHEARRGGDRETFEAKARGVELLDARHDQAMLRLDAPVCATG